MKWKSWLTDRQSLDNLLREVPRKQIDVNEEAGTLVVSNEGGIVVLRALKAGSADVWVVRALRESLEKE